LKCLSEQKVLTSRETRLIENMGNYMSTKLGDGMDQSIGHISNEASSSFHSAAADRTPSRRTFKVEDAQFLDPRSPTVDIERTPIAVSITNILFILN